MLQQLKTITDLLNESSQKLTPEDRTKLMEQLAQPLNQLFWMNDLFLACFSDLTDLKDARVQTVLDKYGIGLNKESAESFKQIYDRVQENLRKANEKAAEAKKDDPKA